MSKGQSANSTLSHYRIVSKIGEGGMGEVYLAQDTKLDRKVALKILPAEVASNRDRMERFVREARSSAALNHPHIAQIHEIGEQDGTHFIVMEFIDGVTLRDRLNRENLALPETLEITLQIASALQAAHDASIIHRDIKPENVMLREDGYVKVLDFGLAKLLEQTPLDAEAETRQQFQTKAGVIMGTVAYMSPEQARGQALDARADLWSLGCVLYELLTQRQPFQGDTVTDVLANIIHQEPVSLRARRPDAPVELERIVQKTLRKDKTERYATAKDLQMDVKQLQVRLLVEAEIERTAAPNREEAKTQILRANTTVHSETRNSIAVLPFANMSADEGNEYFCDGLAEELLNALAKIDELKVAARTSAFSFKGKNASISDIGQKLGVKTVLEGSVRKSGSRLRISVQLVNAADGYHLWSERYDREMQDIFDVQDEITLSVVDALKLKLFGDEKAAVVKRYTENPEAYKAYLKGRYLRHTKNDHGGALLAFEDAVRLDPSHAPSWVGVADALTLAAHYGLIPAREACAKAKAALATAKMIQGELGDAVYIEGFMAFIEGDWEASDKAYRRAIDLQPTHHYALGQYGLTLCARGELDEALMFFERARAADPLAAFPYAITGAGLAMARRADESLQFFEQAFAFEKDNGLALWGACVANVALGWLAEGIAAAEQAVVVSRRAGFQVGLLGWAFAVAGRTKDARAILAELHNRPADAPSLVSEVWLLGALGEKNAALELLTRAEAEQQGFIYYVGLAGFDGLRDDPRFRDLVRRLGLSTPEALGAQPTMLSSGELMSEPPAVAGGIERMKDEGGGMKQAGLAVSDSSFIPHPSSFKHKWWLFGLLSLIILVGGYVGYRYYESTLPINSVAVLPFVNNSSNADSDYLSDGLAESLIFRLSQLPNLKVSPTSSVFRYKGKDTDAKEVADELGVDAVMTGRITQRGDNLAISVELVDVRNNKVLWGEQIERKMSELLATQREIAAEITNKLQLKLSGEGEQKLAKKYTTSNEAYQLYLKGRFYWARRTKDDLLKAVDYYKQAIALDPNFALAYVGIATAYNSMGKDPDMSPREAIPQAKAAATRALEIDPALAEAHAALADSLAIFDWNWVEAERGFKRAIELDPNVSYIHLSYAGSYLTATGPANEVVAETERAMELEPLSLINNTLLVTGYLYARQNDKALQQARKAYDLDPDFALVRLWLGLAYIANGKYDEAIDLGEDGLQKSPSKPAFLYFIAQAYANSGRKVEAQQFINKFREAAKTQYVRTYYLACIYAALGDKDKAFAELEQSFEDKDYFLPRMKTDPLMDPLRGDPRFKAMLKRLNLPE
jgi:TolB-like protein/Flp pilus assembly protein TadD